MLLKLVTTLFVLATLSYAHNPVEPKHHESEEGFYTVVKAIMITGDTVEHGSDVELNGDSGYGIGVDFGYRFTHEFSIEYDTSYSTNSVEEKNLTTGDVEDGTATYTTHAIDLIYSHLLMHHTEIFGKLGYEYEYETIDDFNIDTAESGVAYAAGLEYILSRQNRLVVEYEGTTIEGPHGSAFFVGLMYNF